MNLKLRTKLIKLEGVFLDCWRAIKCFFLNVRYWLKNIFVNRFDLVKLPGIKCYQYADCTERLFLANMELIKDFMEKEKPESFVCWYGDDDIAGPKWHAKEHPLFPMPEYEGRYIMDIVKGIYTWYTKAYPELRKEIYEKLPEITFDEEGRPTLDKKACEESEKLDDKLREDTQRCLHLIIELRSYLWT